MLSHNPKKVRKMVNNKITGENFDCYVLDWDTDYFGIPSAKVNLTGAISETNQRQILEFCDQFEFVTISNFNNINENNIWIGNKTNAFLTDVNVQFQKENTKVPNATDESTTIYNSYQRNEQILNLAKKSFIYSRFFNDPFLNSKEAKEIYYQWTANSFEKTNKFFVVTKRNNNIAGYIIFSINEDSDRATIELIAVDENTRGQGVGRALISKLEAYLYEKEIFNLHVGTQIDNINAFNFYLNNKYNIANFNSVFHMWNKY